MGATLAVLIHYNVLVDRVDNGTVAAMVEGPSGPSSWAAFGLAAAFAIIQLFKRYCAGHLQNPSPSLIVAFPLRTNPGRPLAGNDADGIILANQKRFGSNISQFKEELGIMLLSGLFIILAARLI